MGLMFHSLLGSRSTVYFLNAWREGRRKERRRKEEGRKEGRKTGNEINDACYYSNISQL